MDGNYIASTFEIPLIPVERNNGIFRYFWLFFSMVYRKSGNPDVLLSDLLVFVLFWKPLPQNCSLSIYYSLFKVSQTLLDRHFLWNKLIIIWYKSLWTLVKIWQFLSAKSNFEIVWIMQNLIGKLIGELCKAFCLKQSGAAVWLTALDFMQFCSKTKPSQIHKNSTKMVYTQGLFYAYKYHALIAWQKVLKNLLVFAVSSLGRRKT